MDWNAPAPADLETPKEPLHPTGTFQATVTNATAETTKTDKPMIKLTFKTVHGKVHGRMVYSPGSEKARKAWFRQLSNMQVGKAFLDDGPEVDEVALACIKADVLVRVAHREFEGVEFADVTWIDELPNQAA